MITSISTGRRSLLVSKLGPPNPLPVFQWQQPIAPQDAPPSDKLSTGETENAFIWGAASILPYQIQDSYDRVQQPGQLEVVFVENDFLKLTLYPHTAAGWPPFTTNRKSASFCSTTRYFNPLIWQS